MFMKHLVDMLIFMLLLSKVIKVTFQNPKIILLKVSLTAYGKSSTNYFVESKKSN